MSITRKSLIRFLIVFVIAALIGALFFARAPQRYGGNGKVVRPTIALTSTISNGGAVVRWCGPAGHRKKCPPRTFVNRFKAGRYGHTPERIAYHGGFKTWFKAHARAPFKRAHPHQKYSGEKAWMNFTHHDTCAAKYSQSSTGDCAVIDPYLSSKYYKHRSDEQNKWTARVVWCGTTAIVVYSTGGTASAALGAGSGLCFGGFLVGSSTK